MKTSTAMLSFAALLSLGSALFAETAATQPAATPVNKTCPVAGDAVDPKVTYMWNDKLIGFCCASCITDFKKDPQKYAGKIK